MFNLHVVPCQGQPFDCSLNSDSMVIGRSSASDLVIPDEVISRKHARLFRQESRLFIEDLDSHNGTWVNGRRIKKPTLISLGDVIRLSGSVISVQEPKRVNEASTESSIKKLIRDASQMLSKSNRNKVDSTDEPDQIARYAERLTMLNEIHQVLAKPINSQDLLSLILDWLFQALKPEEGVIFLGRETGELVPASTRTQPGSERDFLNSRSLIEDVTVRGLAVLVHDAANDERFAASESLVNAGVRSLVAAPLMDAEGILGMIVLHSKAQIQQFYEGDLELLVSIASIAAIRIRNIMLNEEKAPRLLDSNRLLETKVTERTHELKQTNQEILRTRDQLIMKEKMASLGTLTAGIAHEIRNPLNFINNFADINIEMLQELRDTLSSHRAILPENLFKHLQDTIEDMAENAGYVSEHGERANRIVERMVSMALQETGTFQGTDLNQLVSEFTKLSFKGLQATQTGIKVKIVQDLDRDLGQQYVVPQNLGRVLINLVTNAIEAVLTKKANLGDPTYQPLVTIRTQKAENHFSITVHDNGHGIAPENIDRVFNPFFTTRPTGQDNVGLGLYISYDIVVHEHHGEIRVDSVENEYTQVIVRLPNLTSKIQESLD